MHMLSGKVALVTGASSGIGRAVALSLAASGAAVVVGARRVSACEELAEQIRGEGGEAVAVALDVRKPEDAESAVAAAVERYGQLDLAFNNAGIEGCNDQLTASYPEDVWHDVIATNLTGVFLSMRYELPFIVKQQGAIVNMASVAGVVGGRLGAAYYASKHGVVGLTRAAAMEYARKGVRVNAVAPGLIPTPMTERAFLHDEKLTDYMRQLHPMNRFGTLEEVARAVVWLLSPQSSFTTGHILPVEGGFLVP